MKWVACFFLFALLAVTAFGQRKSDDLKDLSIEFMLRGYFYAGSRVADKKAPGGFGNSDNFPRSVDAAMKLPRDRIALVVYPDDEMAFAKEFSGFKVVLANTTSAQVGFAASDSRLYIVQEALDEDGKWKPIEYLPSSWCGNSYHTVFLGPGEYWEFAAPRFTGARMTKLRFSLHHDGRGETGTVIYSNEFDGSVNPKQFTERRPYTPSGIMDPYDNE